MFQTVLADHDRSAPVTEFTETSPDDDRYFWKAPVLIAGTDSVTVELVSREVGGLAWMPAAVWGQAPDIDITEFEATTVTFSGCPDRSIIYLGGLLLDEPATCVSLRISRADATVANVQIPFGEADC